MQGKTVKAAEFKAKCLELMDQVAATGNAVTITKRGKPIARLVPMEKRAKSAFGALKGTAVIKGDIVGPIGDDWEAMQ